MICERMIRNRNVSESSCATAAATLRLNYFDYEPARSDGFHGDLRGMMDSRGVGDVSWVCQWYSGLRDDFDDRDFIRPRLLGLTTICGIHSGLECCIWRYE